MLSFETSSNFVLSGKFQGRFSLLEEPNIRQKRYNLSRPFLKMNHIQ